MRVDYGRRRPPARMGRCVDSQESTIGHEVSMCLQGCALSGGSRALIMVPKSFSPVMSKTRNPRASDLLSDAISKSVSMLSKSFLKVNFSSSERRCREFVTSKKTFPFTATKSTNFIALATKASRNLARLRSICLSTIRRNSSIKKPKPTWMIRSPLRISKSLDRRTMGAPKADIKMFCKGSAVSVAAPWLR